MKLTESVEPVGESIENIWIPRTGLRFQLSKELEQVSYYGLGPYGNYNDRCYGSWTAVHKAKVKDHYFPYSKPQDHGNREEVRWLTLSDAKGLGVIIVAPEPLSMSVLPYTQEELKTARHTIDLREPKVTEIRVAAQISGVGNGSCGPATLEQYRATAKPVSYQFYIRPYSPR